MERIRTELWITCACIAAATACLGAALWDLAMRIESLAPHHPWQAVLAMVFGALVALLSWGGLVYQLARAGYFARLSRGAAAIPGAALATRKPRPLAVLIPSYREEPRVLLQTVLSAALMDRPNRRLVVLLDDPPTGSDIRALVYTRRMIGALDEDFAALSRQLEFADHQFRRRLRDGDIDLARESGRLQRLHMTAADWMADRLAGWLGDGAPSHVDRFFAERIVRRVIGDHRDAAARLAATNTTICELAQGYGALATRYRIQITSFERKRYVNLSHAPNKAMNLNAYIGLLGGAFREVVRREGLVLEPCAPDEADVLAPDADFLLTLDADSLVLPDYAAKLTAIMEADDRVAVAQTPYSSFPCAPGRVERVAGATTDLQYIAHQGTSAFAADYWVGANALLRKEALLDIRTWDTERGYQTPVFIQDRTVIEDTGSTVDLIARGWRLHNHPERLAFSATPADFGSLTIQRRRWSNGGLIILPDLLRYLLRRAPKRRLPLEAPVRAHYLVSPAVANLGLLALLLIPFDARLASVWLPLSAAPYYFLYGRDLVQAGYRGVDLVRVYALNLMLLPVNLAGVWDSLRQLVTGRKPPFARTPKVEGRTATPPAILACQAAAVAYLAFAFASDTASMRWQHAIFSGLNFVLFAYGFAAFVGVREAVADLTAAAKSRRRQPLARPSIPAPVLAPRLSASAREELDEGARRPLPAPLDA